ncbi:type II toxin-antitoxin system PemK/MazF family toxin [Bifidobacterium longum]|uniref:type II toxin-antitoxin system PemK/MazF family toxin n=1 Tax=Bifidobacterium longum TaxID=216816 RepID=UPI003C6C0B06
MDVAGRWLRQQATAGCHRAERCRDRFDSVITCLLTSYDSSDIDTRVRLEPSPENGLNKVSYVMTDKIVTVDRKLLGYQVGVVDDAAMANIGRQLMRVLGLL